MAISPTTPPRSPFTTTAHGMDIIYESYLHKTPPLDKLFVKWKKRWFVLSRTDPYDPSSLDLSYYSDHTKKHKRGTINLSKFIGIRPNAKIGNKEHVFAIETEDRKYIMRAETLQIKTVWLAKLCELCGQEPVYHVLLPTQPAISSSGDGILKFKLPKAICVMSPAIGTTLVNISLTDIRRVGCMYSHDNDIVWFETCQSCNGSSGVDQFIFTVVPSGTSTAQSLTREVKVAIERATGAFLILEETTQLEMTFVARNHYGCPCFPALSRSRIMTGGLNDCFERRLVKYQRASEPILSLPSTGLDQFRRPSEGLSNMGLSLEEYINQPHRRGTLASYSPTTPHPPRLKRPGCPTSLDRLRQASISSQNSVDTNEEIIHTPLSDGVFDIPSVASKRNLMKKDSLSSHDSGGSITSANIEHDNHIEITPLRKLSLSKPDLNKPNIPPRSVQSLRRAKTPSVV